MHASLTPGADVCLHAAEPSGRTAAEGQRAAAPEAHRPQDGNFVVGCLVGAAAAAVLWVLLGYAVWSLL